MRWHRKQTKVQANMRLFGLAVGLSLLLTSSPTWAQGSREWVDQAQQAEDAGNFAEAGRAWEKAAAALSKEGDAANRAMTLYLAGLAHYKGDSKEAAVAQLTLAVEAFLAQKDSGGQSLCLLQRGVVEVELSRWSEAERSFRSAVDVARQAGLEERALEATEWLGKSLEAGRRWPEATVLTEGLVAAFRTTAPERVPELLLTLGALYQLQEQLDKAEAAFDESIALYEQQGNAKEVLTARRSLIRFLLKTRQVEKAETRLTALLAEGVDDVTLEVDHAYALAELERHAEALAKLDKLLTRTSDVKLLPVLKVRRVKSLHALGKSKEALAAIQAADFGTDYARALTSAEIGRRDLAESYFQKAIAAASGEPRLNLINEFAQKLIGWGKMTEAATLLQQTLAGLDPKDPRRAIFLGNLGETYLSRGEPAKALPIFLEVLALLQAEREPRADLVTILSNIGTTYEYLGDYKQALLYLEQASQQATRMIERDPSVTGMLGTIGNALGVLHVKMGRYREGQTFYQKALGFHRAAGNVYGETTSLINLGAVQELSGDRSKAIANYDQAMILALREGRKSQQMTILNNLSKLSNDPAKAIGYLEEALLIERSSPDVLSKNIFIANIASRKLQTGQLEDSRKMASEAALALSELGAKENELGARETLMRADLRSDHLASAQEQLDRSLLLLDDVVLGLSSASARKFVQEHESELRYGLVPLLEGDQVSKAFAVDETLRSLGLAALTNGIPLPSAHLPPELVSKEATLLTAMREASLSGQDLTPLRQELGVLREQMERFHLAAGALHSMESAELEKVSSLIKPDEAMLTYLVAGPDLWAVAITAEGAKAQRIADLETLKPLITSAFRRVNSPTRAKETEEALAALSQALWQPAQALVEGKKRLIIVPAGPLYSVPFAALLEGTAPLADRYRLTMVSSASAWLVSRESSSRGRGMLVAALGNFAPSWSRGGASGGERSASFGSLPGTLAELGKIASLFETPQTLKEEAMTAEALRRESTGRRQIHLATHGLLDAEDPMNSGLVASDRLVTAAEIFTWDLDAELAVLSACQSGQVSQGWEFVSLTRAFQFAGARTLLATNWAVSDEVTAQWMDAFYAALGSGQPADEAAHTAYLSIREDHPHPYYWAPFALWGDGVTKSF